MTTENPIKGEPPTPQEAVREPPTGPQPAKGLPAVPEVGSRRPLSERRTSSPAAPAARKEQGEPRRLDQLLWSWPVCAVAVMAAAGHFFGAYGALLSAVVVTATLVLLVGVPEVIGPRSRVWVLALAVVAIGGVVTGRYAGVGFLAAPPDVVTPLDLRGRVVEVDDLRNRDLRDGQLQGAVFDGLDLRGRDLSGVRAQGASFRRVVLDDVLFVGADLRGADFTDACLERADLSGARLAGVLAGGADVRAAVVDAERTAEAATWPQPGAAVPPHCG